MINAKTSIIEMSYEESVSYFKRLANLKKIRLTNGLNLSSLLVDIKECKSDTSSVGESNNHKGSNMWCHYLLYVERTIAIHDLF
jgi:hypothetical protein